MFEFVGGQEEQPWDWKSSMRVRLVGDGVDEVGFGADMEDSMGVGISFDFLNLFFISHIDTSLLLGVDMDIGLESSLVMGEDFLDIDIGFDIEESMGVGLESPLSVDMGIVLDIDESMGIGVDMEGDSLDMGLESSLDMGIGLESPLDIMGAGIEESIGIGLVLELPIGIGIGIEQTLFDFLNIFFRSHISVLCSLFSVGCWVLLNRVS